MTIFRGRQKCDNKICCHLQQQQEEDDDDDDEEEEEEAQKCDKKMRGRMLTGCGMTRTSHCALHLRTSRAHERHQRHITMRSPYGVAGLVCEAL